MNWKSALSTIFLSLIALILGNYILLPVLDFIGNEAWDFLGRAGRNFTDQWYAIAADSRPVNIVTLAFFGCLLLGTVVYVYAIAYAILPVTERIFSKLGYTSMVLRRSPEGRRMFILTISGLTIVVYSSLFFFFPFSLQKNFERDVAVVAPYLSETQEEQFRANWAQMENKLDYREIVKELEQIAQQNGLHLESSIAADD